MLSARAADDDGKVIRRASSRAERLHLLLEEEKERFRVQHGARLLVKKGLIRRAAALRHEEEIILSTILGEDLDLGGEVRPRIHLLIHRQRGELAIAEVLFLVGLEDAARDRLFKIGRAS